MKWTDKPTEKGWYWMRSKRGLLVAICYVGEPYKAGCDKCGLGEVEPHGQYLHLNYNCEADKKNKMDGWWDISSCNPFYECEFYGPMPKPPEKQGE